MHISQDIKALGKVSSVGALIDKAESLPASAWLEDSSRQELFSNVHAETQTLVLLFCDTDKWPELDVQPRSAWDSLHHDAVPVMKEILTKHYPRGGAILRAMVARLRSGCQITRHKDAHPSFAAAHRIHVPLITNEQVDFYVNDHRVDMKVGWGYEINNLLMHSVQNNSEHDRVHFIFDYAPPSFFDRPGATG